MPAQSPQLRFKREWRLAVEKHQAATGTLGQPVFKNLEVAYLQNVVVHVSRTHKAWAHAGRMACGGHLGAQKAGAAKSKWTGAMLATFSATNPDSPFQNNSLVFQGHKGRYLEFNEKKNAIRAGKHTAACSILSILRWNLFRNYPLWWTLSSPNSVISARLRTQLTEQVKDDPQMAWTNKFPGVAFISTGKSRCTPELYTGYNKRLKRQRQSSVIFPGTGKSASDFLEIALEVDAITQKYSKPYDTSVFTKPANNDSPAIH